MSFDIRKNKHQQDNKITLIDEQQLQPSIRVKPIQTYKRINKQLSKKQFKRTTTIIDDYDDISKRAFEDSRITRMIFEKYRIVELTRFWFIISSSILNIVEYEYTFKDYFLKTMEDEITVLLYLIFSMTIIIIFLTIVAYLIDLEYRKTSKIISNKATLFQTNLIWGLLLELLILIPTSNPYTKNYQITFLQRGSGEIRFYLVNEILTYIMFFRLYILLNIGFKFQTYFSNRIGRLCRLYQTRFGTHLMLKLCIRQFPFYTLTWLFMIGFIQYTYQLEIAERPLLRSLDNVNEYNLNKSSWVTMITIATVGYGDFFPYTDLGRLAMTLGLFYGVTITSLFTAILYNMLQPKNEEYLSWALLDKTTITKNMRKASSRIFYFLNQIKKSKQTKKQLNGDNNYIDIDINETLFNLENYLSEIGMLKRMHRDIDGEEFMQMVKRKFGDANFQFKDFRAQLQKFKEFQQIIQMNLLTGISKRDLENLQTKEKIQEQKMSNSSKVNSWKMQTDEKLSKDDDFFNNLEDSNKDSYLMSFHE